MDEQLTKSLTDLIDETLSELEELRKSKMSAAEIKIEGPGEGVAGKPSNGELEAKKADEDEEEDEDEESEEAEKSEDEEDEDEDEEAEKSDEDEGHETDDPADKPSTQRKLKALMEAKKAEDAEEDEEVEKSWSVKKKEKKEPHKDDPKHEEKEKKIAKKLLDMHKSEDEVSTLMKSYVEERIQPLEQKLETILELVNSIAEQPVAPKGVTVKTAPLLKSASAEYGETLSKAEIANKLFELKKSGTRVDSLDIAKAEMGQDLVNIVKKYEIS